MTTLSNSSSTHLAIAEARLQQGMHLHQPPMHTNLQISCSPSYMQHVESRLSLKRVEACLLHETAAYWPVRLNTNKDRQ